jgi:hypothetical protein
MPEAHPAAAHAIAKVRYARLKHLNDIGFRLALTPSKNFWLKLHKENILQQKQGLLTGKEFPGQALQSAL